MCRIFKSLINNSTHSLLKEVFRKMGSIYSFKVTLLIFCFIAFWGGLSTNLSADNLSNNEYTIGPEDILEIQVWDNEDLNRIVEVSQEGTFTFHLIDKVHADGLSIFELENLIEKRLADGYILDPQVTVSINEYHSRKVFLLGEVQKPGSYILKRKTHILELISEAGGFTSMAGQTIKIVRPKSQKQSEGHVSPAEDKENEIIITLDIGKFSANSAHGTFFVKSGDSVYVNPTPRIYVIGAVEKPGAIKWKKSLTVRQAISSAGGSTQMAALKRTKIIRINKNGKENEITARMDDLVTPDDIIKVPERMF